MEAPLGERRGTRVVFTQRQARRAWAITLPARSQDDYAREPRLLWSPDSRACAIRSEEGWRVAYPRERRSRLVLTGISSHAESDAAWSPRTNRLAIFEGEGAPFYIWDGRRLSRGKEWVASTGYPYAGDVRIWQAAWSPDERAILLRFYGHAERGSEAPGHAALLSPRTGRGLYDWGAEAGPATWLDARRFAYQSDEDGLGVAGALVVAEPSARRKSQRRQVWLKDAVAWTVATKRSEIWALRSNGTLIRSPARARQWRSVRRIFASRYGTRLEASPHGDIIAALSGYEAKNIALVSMGPRPWLATWAAPGGTVEVAGWEPGHSLPRLWWTPSQDKAARLIQLKW